MATNSEFAPNARESDVTPSIDTDVDPNTASMDTPKSNYLSCIRTSFVFLLHQLLRPQRLCLSPFYAG